MSRHREPIDPATILAAFSDVTAALANAADNGAVFVAAEQAAQRCIGHKLFTVMAFDAEKMQVQRLYSSNAGAYPPGGRKDKRDTAWGRQVLDEGKPYIGYTAADIRASFDDHDVILGLQLESVLNMPIRAGGRTLGTVNLLHGRDYYRESDLTTVSLLAALLVAPVSSWRSTPGR